jgi:tetratricopeptide (TPR) repeat protein
MQNSKIKLFLIFFLILFQGLIINNCKTAKKFNPDNSVDYTPWYKLKKVRLTKKEKKKILKSLSIPGSITLELGLGTVSTFEKEDKSESSSKPRPASEILKENQKLLKQLGEDDEKNWKIYESLYKNCFEINDFQNSYDYALKGIESLKRLEKKSPKNVDIAINLAIAYTFIAGLLQQGHPFKTIYASKAAYYTHKVYTNGEDPIPIFRNLQMLSEKNDPEVINAFVELMTNMMNNVDKQKDPFTSAVMITLILHLKAFAEAAQKGMTKFPKVDAYDKFKEIAEKNKHNLKYQVALNFFTLFQLNFSGILCNSADFLNFSKPIACYGKKELYELNKLCEFFTSKEVLQIGTKDIYKYAGVALLLSRKLDDSLSYFSKSIEVDSSDTNLMGIILYLYIKVKDEPKKGLEFIERIIKNKGIANYRDYYLLAHAYGANNLFKKGIEACQKAYQLDNTNKNALVCTAIMHIKNGNQNKGKNILDNLLKDKDITDNWLKSRVYHSRAKVYLLRGDAKSAFWDFKAALKLEPDDKKLREDLNKYFFEGYKHTKK